MNFFTKTKTTKICPHEDCGKPFDTAMKAGGILFCPHCQRSVLLSPIKKLGDLLAEKLSSSIPIHKKLKFDWCLFTNIKYSLSAFMVMLVLLIIRSGHVDISFLEDFTLLFLFIISYIIIFLIWIFFGVNIENSLKYRQSEVLKGVDNLSEVEGHNINFVGSTGQLAAPTVLTQTFNDSYQQIEGCPCCGSQQVAGVTNLLYMNFRYYEQHNIRRPDGMPKSFFDVKTQTYYDTSPVFKDMLVCLHCHQHFIWSKVKKSGLKTIIIGLSQVLFIVFYLVFMFGFSEILLVFDDWVRADFQYLFRHGLLSSDAFILIADLIMKVSLLTAMVLFLIFLLSFIQKLIINLRSFHYIQLYLEHKESDANPSVNGVNNDR